MKVTVQHIHNDPNQPLALHVDGELMPGQSELDILSRRESFVEVIVRLSIYKDGPEIVGVKPA